MQQVNRSPLLRNGSIAQFSAESSPELGDHISPVSLSLLLITLLGLRVEMDFCPNECKMMKCTAAQAQSRGKQRSGWNLSSLIEFDRGVSQIHSPFALFHT